MNLGDVLAALESDPQEAVMGLKDGDKWRRDLVKELIDRLCEMHGGKKDRDDDALASLEDHLLWRDDRGDLLADLFDAYLGAGLGNCVVRVFEQAKPDARPDLAKLLLDELSKLVEKTGGNENRKFAELARAWEQVGDLHAPEKTEERLGLIQCHVKHGGDCADRLAGLKDRLGINIDELLAAVISSGDDIAEALAGLKPRLRLTDKELVGAVVGAGGDYADRVVALRDHLGLSRRDLAGVVISLGDGFGERLAALKGPLEIEDEELLNSAADYVEVVSKDAALPIDERKAAIDAIADWLFSLDLPDGSPEAALRDEARAQATSKAKEL